jgi:surfeit locus 1 family protein
MARPAIRKLVWPLAMTLVMELILIALGTWQLRRLAWKEGILAQIARAEAAPPIPLHGTPSPFEKVAVTGRLLPGKSALYGAQVRDTRSGPELGAQLIDPLRQDSGETILVDRGWVPFKPAAPIATPEGIVTIAGFIRTGDRPGLFSARDNVAKREFYTLDPPAIAAALGLADVAPYVLVALGPPPPDGLPIPAQHLPRPPNNHLQYALTWYGLAGVLVVIFSSWARKAVRT